MEDKNIKAVIPADISQQMQEAKVAKDVFGIVEKLFVGIENFKSKAELINVVDHNDKESIKKAKELRLEIKRERIDSQKLIVQKREDVKQRKSLFDMEDKAYIRIIKVMDEKLSSIEDGLEEKEKIAEKYEEQQREIRLLKRKEIVNNLSDSMSELQYKDMSEETFNIFVSGLENAKKEKEEAERKRLEEQERLEKERIKAEEAKAKAAEEARLEREKQILKEKEEAEKKLKKLERDRDRESKMKGLEHLTNIGNYLEISDEEFQSNLLNLKKLKEKEDKQIELQNKKIEEEKQKKLAAEKAEKERLEAVAKEMEAQNKALEEKRKKAEAESNRLKAENQRIENERIAKEKAEKERLEKLAKASEVEKLIDWINNTEIKQVNTEILSKDSIDKAMLIISKFEAFRNWAIKLINDAN